MKNISDEKLINTIKNSKTIHEVLVTLGMNTSSGSYKSFKKRVTKLNIDTTHFLTKKEVINNLLIQPHTLVVGVCQENHKSI